MGTVLMTVFKDISEYQGGDEKSVPLTLFFIPGILIG